MKFECKEISISDKEFGLTITLSEKQDDGIAQMNMSIDELMNSSGQYLLLQKTYAEDEEEGDYYYIETSISAKSGELRDFDINLNRRQFLITCYNETFKIDINANENEYDNLKNALKKFNNNEGHINIQE